MSKLRLEAHQSDGPSRRHFDFAQWLLRTSGFILLAACSSSAPTTIDGSSPQTFERTTDQARRDLPVADRLDFDRALASVGTRRFGSEDKDALARTTFDGMTAAQVVQDYRVRQH